MDIGLCFCFPTHAEDNGLQSALEADPLENLLIEHPSMSVYQMRCRRSRVEEEELLGDEEDREEEENSSRFVKLRFMSLTPD